MFNWKQFAIVVLLVAAAWQMHRMRKSQTDIKETPSNLLFSETYLEAKAKFRDLAPKAGATLHHLKYFTKEKEEYVIDIAVLHGKGDGGDGTSSRKKLVLHISGTHGVEGHAGSAI